MSKRVFEITILFETESQLSSDNIITRIAREFSHDIDDIKFAGSSCGKVEDNELIAVKRTEANP